MPGNLDISARTSYKPKQAIKNLIKKVPLALPLYLRVLQLRQGIRTRYLRIRYPAGKFLRCNGIDVFCDFHVQTYSWYADCLPNLAFDQALIQSLFAECRGNVALDIGAHFGFFAAYLSELGQQRSDDFKVIALEPDPGHFHCLQRTMSRFPANAAILLPMAISDTPGILNLYRTAAASCLHSYLEPGAQAIHQVSAISLDELVQQYLAPDDKIAFIKIDVDGAEPLFLAGGKKTLEAHSPVILIEFAPVHLAGFGRDPEQFFGQLCEQFVVYWVSYQQQQLKAVTPVDYLEIKQEILHGVTDLILSRKTLKAIPPSSSIISNC